jgi:hypothetical protein
MRVETLQLDDPRWTEVLSRVPHDIYHTPPYVRIDAERIDALGRAVVASDGGRHLFLPYLLRSCDGFFAEVDGSIKDVVSPYGYPGILIDEAGRDAGFVAEAWAAVCRQWSGDGACAAFLRMHPILGHGSQHLFPAGILLESGETVAVDLLQEEEALWLQISEKHRQTIGKCRKLGFGARFVPLASVLDPFLEVYKETMDRVRAQESYYFGREYFAALARMSEVHCCVVEKGTDIAAACILFESQGIVQAHLGGTSGRYFSQSPFHLCIHEAIHWARQRVNRWLHLGGGLGGANDMLLKFKARFSPLRFQFHTARVVLRESLYRSLVERAAAAAGCSCDDLLRSTYFPAYRATPSAAPGES